MTIDEIRMEPQSMDDYEKGIVAEELLESIASSYGAVHERARQLESVEFQGISFEVLNNRLGR